MPHQNGPYPLPDKRLQLSIKKHVQTGFTLIELMVTLLIGMLLTLAVLVIQAELSRANMLLADASQRNDQARSALDLLQRDLGNALYMLGGTTPRCEATLQYTGAAATPVATLHGVTARPQPAPLPASTAVADALLKPDAYASGEGGVTNASDMLAVTLVPSALRAPPASGAQSTPYKVVHNVVATASSGQQAVNDGWLPLNNTTGIAAGDALTLLLPLSGAAASGLACLRFTAGSLGTVSLPAPATGTVAAVHMAASGKFADFTQPLRDAGLLAAGQVLTNGQLVGTKLKNDGPAAGQGAVQTLVYYVARAANGASGSVPVLARATINADGTLAAQPAPVAAGVVSLQALFGVDGISTATPPTGGVTHYRTWPQVTAGQLAGRVRTVLYAVVARTLQAHRENPEVTQVDIPSPQLAAGDPVFTAFRPRTDDEKRDRYTVHTAEVALRNQIWGR